VPTQRPAGAALGDKAYSPAANCAYRRHPRHQGGHPGQRRPERPPPGPTMIYRTPP